MTAKHTPGPWEWGKDRSWLFRDNLKHDGNYSSSTVMSLNGDPAFRPSELDAAYIIHAANNFPKAQALADYLRIALFVIEANKKIVWMGEDAARAALAAWDAKP